MYLKLSEQQIDLFVPWTWLLMILRSYPKLLAGWAGDEYWANSKEKKVHYLYKEVHTKHYE